MAIPIHHSLLREANHLPIRNDVARVAVGTPDSLTSNAWRIWCHKGNVYIACRDNFKAAKVSLHVSGRWRMGFTEESVRDGEIAIPGGGDRTWEKWEKPAPDANGLIHAFHLYFDANQLVVEPELRTGKDWHGVLYVEAPPPQKLTVISVFVSERGAEPVHGSEPFFILAEHDLAGGQKVFVVVHAEPAEPMRSTMAKAVERGAHQIAAARTEIPPSAFAYFLGHHASGGRLIFASPIRLPPAP